MSSGTGGCHDRALKLLAARPHFRRELERKLLRKGFGPQEVDAACEALERGGLLDDETTAREMVAGPLRRKGYGTVRLRAELERRGVAEEIVDRVLAGRSPQEDAAQARRQADRWLASHPFDRARLGRHLYAKGYGQATILALLEEIEGAAEASQRP